MRAENFAVSSAPSFARVPLKLITGQFPVLPALAAVAVFLALAASDGGFSGTSWYPAALFLLGLLLVSLTSIPRVGRTSRRVTAAALLFGAYAAWSYLSIAWADQRGDAWDGANRAALFAVVFALFALWPLEKVRATTVLGVFAAGVAVIGLVELLRAASAADPRGYFITGRFSEPVGYPNANVALWFSAFWPCVVLASRRELAPPLRGLFLGASGLLLGLALMGQSRGWLFAVPVAAIVFLVVVPKRTRVGLALIAVGLGGLLVRERALSVYEAVSRGEPIVAPLGEATRIIVLTAAALVVVGTLVGYLDLAVTISPSAARRAAAALLAVSVLALAGAGSAWVASVGDPVAFVGDKWEEFKTTPTPRGGASRFGGALGSYRYDFWRVAWDSFRQRPLIGVGIDNFQQDYLEQRRSPEEPLHPHSLELRVLSQTGLVGAALMLAAIAAAASAAWSTRRRRSDLAAATVVGSSMVFAYWLIHGSVDWFYEFPGLAAPAFAMLGLAVAAGRPIPAPAPGGGSAPRPGRPFLRGPAGIAIAAAAACLLSASFAAPWFAQRDVDRAAVIWSVRAAEAFNRLARASEINPLASTPKLVAASIALRVGRLDLAERDFRTALDRDPRNAYAALELGAIASERGHNDLAAPMLRLAVRLNPRDAVSTAALRRVRSGRRLDIAKLNQEILDAAFVPTQ